MLSSLSIVLLLLQAIISPRISATILLTVNSETVTGPLTHFWKSTGFCPPAPHEDAYKFDYGRDMRQNLAFIGAIPHGGIEQVRVHWLLDLITVIRIQNGQLVYDFSQLDDLVYLLFQLELKPGFEIMGNPSSFFTNFDDKTQVYLWKNLVQQTAKNYIAQYGLGWVMSWNFETWNEPDCHDFDKMNISVQGFLNYYDACSEGLKAASPLLKLGGPGDGCRHTKYSDAFLYHVVNGPNYFTGESFVRVDFLSYHEKGDNSSSVLMEKELTLMKDILRRYPSLANVPFYNDEADPLVGWSKDEWWRADATYAAMVTKIIAEHQNMILQNPDSVIKNYTLLSNDNAFLSWFPHQFTERTLLARFQINNTEYQHTQLFRKPVYSVMGLLALLGEKQIRTSLKPDCSTFQGSRCHGDWYPDHDFGMLGSIHEPSFPGGADSWQMTLLIYYSNDTGGQTKHLDVNVTLDINPPHTDKDLMLVTWIVDNKHGNPYAVWQGQGSPVFPTLKQTTAMRTSEGAAVLPQYSKPVKPGVVSLGMVMFATPSVWLFHVCSKPDAVPDQVNGLHFFNITLGQVVITWSDNCVNSRCIHRYDVDYSSKSPDGPYIRLTTADQYGMDTVLVYQPLSAVGQPDQDTKVRGYYRVRAVDYWNRPGEFSLPVHYS